MDRRTILTAIPAVATVFGLYINPASPAPSLPARVDVSRVPIIIWKINLELYSLPHFADPVFREELKHGWPTVGGIGAIHYAVAQRVDQMALRNEIRRILDLSLNRSGDAYPPAGPNRGIVDLPITVNIPRLVRGFLYDTGINPIFCLPGRGPVVWGQKFIDRKGQAQRITGSRSIDGYDLNPAFLELPSVKPRI